MTVTVRVSTAGRVVPVGEMLAKGVVPLHVSLSMSAAPLVSVITNDCGDAVGAANTRMAAFAEIVFVPGGSEGAGVADPPGLGETVGDGLGEALGDGLGDTLGDGLGDAEGTVRLIATTRKPGGPGMINCPPPDSVGNANPVVPAVSVAGPQSGTKPAPLSADE